MLVYARQHPSFDASTFEFAANKDLRPGIKEPELRAFFDAQVEAFTKGVPPKRPAESSLTLTIPNFRSSTVFKDGEED